MREPQNDPGRSARRFFVAGAALEVAAGVLGLAGLTVCTVAVAALTRHRVARMETPPSELARRHWARARAATSAGMVAWRGVPFGPRTDALLRPRDTARG
ncbi:hypothetical protein CLV70_104423 [Pseudosporangium ferrugineum]|uniref:Uncharacterized protein n=1 Tax=Pseudosporangium ferrugineum TaxID=439699 RepID=A0A2T0SBW5_9ACTN|nr:hypothetical protein CLV70_104423 [Pseudosporangium ferrugineum]